MPRLSPSRLAAAVLLLFLPQVAPDPSADENQQDTDTSVPSGEDPNALYGQINDSNSYASDSARSPETGKYDEEAIRHNCDRGGIQQGPQYLSYNHIRVSPLTPDVSRITSDVEGKVNRYQSSSPVGHRLWDWLTPATSVLADATVLSGS